MMIVRCCFYDASPARGIGLVVFYSHATSAIDHNGYVVGDKYYILPFSELHSLAKQVQGE